MPVGGQLAGAGLAGAGDPIPAPAAPLRRPLAMRFDPMTRDFPLGDDGRPVELHPIDSRVQMALLVEAGKLGSSPSTGNTLRQIPYLDPARIGAEVRDRVRRALLRLTTAGDITIDQIEHETRGRGTLLVAVHYFNERLPDRPRMTFAPSSGTSRS